MNRKELLKGRIELTGTVESLRGDLHKLYEDEREELDKVKVAIHAKYKPIVDAKEAEKESASRKILEIDRDILAQKVYPEGTCFISTEHYEEEKVAYVSLNWADPKEPKIRYQLKNDKLSTGKDIYEEDLIAQVNNGKYKIKQDNDFTLGKSITFKNIAYLKTEADSYYYRGITRNGITVIFYGHAYKEFDTAQEGTFRLALRGSRSRRRHKSLYWQLDKVVKDGKQTSTIYIGQFQISKVCLDKEEVVMHLL